MHQLCRSAPSRAPSSPRARSGCRTCPTRTRSEWRELDSGEVALLDAAKVVRTYEPGETVFAQGTACHGIHCIGAGALALRCRDGGGRSAIVRVLISEQTVGWADLFSGCPHGTTAEALTEARVCLIDHTAVGALLRRRPALGAALLRRLSCDVVAAEQATLQAVTLPLRARVAHVLLALRERFGEVDEAGVLHIALPLSRRDLAAMVGARPESITRTIRALERGGVASFRGRRVAVADLDCLLDAAGVDGPVAVQS